MVSPRGVQRPAGHRNPLAVGCKPLVVVALLCVGEACCSRTTCSWKIVHGFFQRRLLSNVQIQIERPNVNLYLSIIAQIVSYTGPSSRDCNRTERLIEYMGTSLGRGRLWRPLPNISAPAPQSSDDSGQYCRSQWHPDKYE